MSIPIERLAVRTNEVGDDSRCCVRVWSVVGRGSEAHQCTRNRGHGPNGDYCKQHAKKLKENEGVL